MARFNKTSLLFLDEHSDATTYTNTNALDEPKTSMLLVFGTWPNIGLSIDFKSVIRTFVIRVKATAPSWNIF